MLLKTFFFDLYLLITNIYTYLLFVLLVSSQTFLIASLRVKFFMFLVLILLLSVWGFLYNLDGMMLVMLTTEFTILLFFLMTYLQVYSNFTFFTKNFKLKTLTPIIAFCLYSLPTSDLSLNFYNYYTTVHHVITSDFFILYLLLFDRLPLLVIIITLIISFFSLFFILLYFNLKIVKLLQKKTNKQLYFLRKQVLLKQTVFKSQVYTFQQ